MQKKELRQAFRNKRNALTTIELSKFDDLLLIQFQTVDLPPVNTLLSYWPIEQHKEPNTHLFTAYLEFKFPGLQVCYPQADFNTTSMTAILANEDTTFERRGTQIYEPLSGWVVEPGEIDMVFVPLLAFDSRGYRVGYGKGFYDRFLPLCREDCARVGFSYFDPVESIDDCDQFDVPLDLCITPQAVYVF